MKGVGVQVSTFQARVNVPMQHHDSTFICLYVEIQSPIILADHISDRFTYYGTVAYLTLGTAPNYCELIA